MTLVKRLVNILVIMFGVSIIIFGLTRVLPRVIQLLQRWVTLPSDAHIERIALRNGS